MSQHLLKAVVSTLPPSRGCCRCACLGNIMDLPAENCQCAVTQEVRLLSDLPEMMVALGFGIFHILGEQRVSSHQMSLSHHLGEKMEALHDKAPPKTTVFHTETQLNKQKPPQVIRIHKSSSSLTFAQSWEPLT